MEWASKCCYANDELLGLLGYQGVLMMYINGSPDPVFTGGHQSIRATGGTGEGVFWRHQC